ncbi:alpha-1,2-mannosyltransferase [Nocardioides exalbidus]|uniref:Alpha-1,2-mannosyltransferase n=1 Tax=Nocardioides exalbidus TaxID=402596 RepID=A0A1H4JFG6_9ACTN|nr:hypothetical protein [Nocardioides exalbidus]SEB28658.1 alpha-1,2-mannosyltransferase [Nocardioides exalbidus]SEB44388.1 alpha-1,2-mannosyltransferase [Nocardioides exalbidus]
MPRRLVPLLLFVLLAGVYALTTNPDPSPDAFTADFAGRHIALTGDPVPDISGFPYLDHNIIRETWIVETADGREAVGRAPGVIAAVVPAYALARPATVDPLPGGLTAALLSALAVVLFFLVLRDRIGTHAALVASGILGLATPVWSVSADAVWPHTLTTLGILGTAWAADRRRWWLVGLFGGVMLWGRLHAALVCAVVGLGPAWTRRRPAIAVRVGVVALASLGLSSVWTRWMYGSWDPTSGYRAGDFIGNAAGYALDPLNWLGFVVSADRGLLWWAPLLLVLGPTAWRHRGDLPDWSRWLAAGGAAYTLSQAVLNRFSGGDHFYGYRTSLELVVSLSPALALATPWLSERARRWFVPVAVLQLVLIAPGAISDDMYAKVRDVWWRNAFVDALLTRPTELLPLVALTMAVALVAVRLLHTAPATAWLDRADLPGAGLRKAAAGSGCAPPSTTDGPLVPPIPEWHPPARR